ncbi:MAG: DapH/DapD/GlmU-related protein [Erysipelotrichaceae bacterium]
MFYSKEELVNKVNAIDYNSIFVEKSVVVEEGVTLLPNVIVLGNSVIEKGVKLGPNCYIDNSKLCSEASVISSHITNSIIGKTAQIGPFSHIRDGADIGECCKIGNFVEVKKSSVGSCSKASHLAYLGDSEVGKKVNFGCGAITVNYNGVLKQKTIIGDNVFIGSNSNLIAPITIGDGSFIACGSTINSSIPDNCFSIARVRQQDKGEYAEILKSRYKDDTNGK